MKSLALLGMAAFLSASIALAQPSAQTFSGQKLKSEMITLANQAKSSGSAGKTLSQHGNQILMLSVRTQTGAAELHEDYDDVIVVKGGNATLVTGGKLVAPKSEGNGELRGERISGGTSRKVGPGDVLDIPAGTPHQFLIPADTVLSSFVVKVKE